MVRYNDMFLNNLEGVIYHKYTPLMYFRIVNRILEAYETYGWKPVVDGGTFGIGHFRAYGVSYFSVNEFFRSRVVPDGAQDIKEYLRAVGLKYYDFEKLVKTICGWDALDLMWLKFDGGEVQDFDEIVRRVGLELDD